MHIEWKDSYLLNDTLIDRQHKELFVLANIAISATDQPAFKRAAVTLYRYMQKHFSDEMLLMREVNFPDYKHHIGLHHGLLSKFSAILLDIVKGEWNRSAIHTLMTEWFLQHMGEEDAKIAAHTRSYMT